ncbi:hypothetical protein ACFSC6_12750 [Rufibacter sediminis]|uniref:Lipocalin-like domain-containing protein n=1 Tax=Rufibacter sediminis TaxID=2762756 RepID=A0ABR6VU65_9BACT|nr:hypothetical protein [Rufibacter sediminis]MBC3540752.1 hypothetical protein [Rufibacter sediminis]
MLKKSYLLTLLAAFTLVFSSCDKNDDKEENDPKPTVEAQLAQKTWELDEHEVQFDGQSPQDILEIVQGQAGTDDIAFKLDGKGGFALLLDGDEEEEGDYEYEIDGDNIIWNYPLTYTWAESEDDIHEYEFELKGNTLILTVDGTDLEGNDFEETITFKAK